MEWKGKWDAGPAGAKGPTMSKDGPDCCQWPAVMMSWSSLNLLHDQGNSYRYLVISATS